MISGSGAARVSRPWIVVAGVAASFCATFSIEAKLWPAERFLARSVIANVAVSPDGEHLAYVRREAQGDSVWLYSAASDERRRLLAARRLAGISWSVEGAGLIAELDDRLAFVPTDGDRPQVFHRLDESREERYRGPDPSLGGAVLSTDDEAPHRLSRIHLDGRREVLWEGARPVADFLFDERGELRWIEEIDGLEKVLRRAAPDAPEVLRCGFRDACALLAMVGEAKPGNERLWLWRRWQEELWALTELDPASGRERLVHRDPEGRADLARVEVEAGSGRPLLAVHHTTARRSYALDPKLTETVATLQERFAGRDLVIAPRPQGRFWWLIEVGDRLQHPRFHVYTPATDSAREVLADERAAGNPLPEEALARRRPISYRASDGFEVHGFVTLPPGRGAATAPMVVKVHGGPWNHVRTGWDPILQLLANRGYVVFEPNFRASTGHGLTYLLAAGDGFGDGRVQQDILDGVDHLLAEGIGDADRVAILGHSFGGFSTLGGLAFTPRRFRAGIASAPPIDLVRTLREYDDDATFAGGLPLKDLLRRYFFDFEDPAVARGLQERSPLAHVGATERPLLILAGARDPKVAVADVRHYAAALEDRGLDVSLLVDGDSGHGFDHRLLRRAYAHLVERFLGHHLGGAVGPPADDDLNAYLARNLDLTGESLATALGD